jgi:hypothetical protein
MLSRDVHCVERQVSSNLSQLLAVCCLPAGTRRIRKLDCHQVCQLAGTSKVVSVSNNYFVTPAGGSVQDVRELCRIEGVYSRWMTLSLPIRKADWHLPSVPNELQAMSGKAMLWEGLIRWAVRQLLPCVNASNSVGVVFRS